MPLLKLPTLCLVFGLLATFVLNCQTRFISESFEELTNANFTKHVKKMFVHTWVVFCGNFVSKCYERKGVLKALEEQSHNRLRRQQFTFVNCENAASQELCINANVNQFPTVALYFTGRHVMNIDLNSSEADIKRLFEYPPATEVSFDDLLPEITEYEPPVPEFTYLTEDNYTQEIGTVQQQLVMFCINSVDQCEKEINLFRSAAQLLQADNKRFVFIDCNRPKLNRLICRPYQLPDVSTIVYYRKSIPWNVYNWEWDPKSLVEYFLNAPAKRTFGGSDLHTGRMSIITDDKAAETRFLTKIFGMQQMQKLIDKPNQHALAFVYKPYMKTWAGPITTFNKYAGKYQAKFKNIIFLLVECDRIENKYICSKRNYEQRPEILYYINARFKELFKAWPPTDETLGSYLKELESNLTPRRRM